MQNEDEELRGLEKKLGRLKPKDMDESCIGHLITSFDRERKGASEDQEGGIYPQNVLWMRFAPVAAAAGVVLLGTFFLRYESRMEALQAQRTDATKMGGVIVNTNKTNTLTPVTSEVEGSINSRLISLPVPRLGVGEQYGVSPYSFDTGLLSVSGQSYLQPAGEDLSDFNRNGVSGSARLHFEDAYDWQVIEARDQKETRDQKSAVNGN